MPSLIQKQGPTSGGNEAANTKLVEFFPSSNAPIGNPDENNYLEKVFKLNLCGYEAGANQSRTTRKPGDYDKHLDECLRPAKLAYCPDMVKKLAEVADVYNKKYIEKFGSPPPCSEAGFRATKGGLFIVSALAFEIPRCQTRYLEWTLETKQDKAIPDAVLCINLDIPARVDESHDCPYGRRKVKFGRRKALGKIVNDSRNLNCHICDDPSVEELKNAARYFPNIVIYEFKNLKSGSLENFTALLQRTSCASIDWAECDKECTHERIFSEIPVTGSPNGFDAEIPIIQVAATDWTETDVARSLSTYRPLVDIEDTHKADARYIMHQIWSEMVRNDATFLVLNGGNFELIAFRNRAERTLYLSDIIATTSELHKPSEFGYVQIHIGLYIASIRDAVDRAAQLRACEVTNTLPCSWTAYSGHHRAKVPRVMTRGPANIEQLLFNCQRLCVVPAKEGGALQYRPCNLYERYPKECRSGEQESSDLKITAKATKDSNIHTGTVESPGQISKNYFILKTAFGSYATQILAKEFRVYLSLGGNPQMCKIPVVYGFFVDSSDPDDPCAVLLLQFVGVPLSGELTVDQWRSLSATMNHIHERRYEYSKYGNERNI